jgi:hypothetical protein
MRQQEILKVFQEKRTRGYISALGREGCKTTEINFLFLPRCVVTKSVFASNKHLTLSSLKNRSSGSKKTSSDFPIY